MNWYQKAFTKTYLDVYAHRDEKQATEEVAFAKKNLNINSNDVVLDLCCGAGRHAFQLAKFSKIVVAYDLSSDLLIKAIDLNKKKLCSNIFWQQGDMLQLNYKATFDAIVSFFNSFGYFDDENQNEIVIEKIFNALRPEGKLLLDIMNKSYILKNLKAYSEKTINEYTVKENRWISNEGKRVNKEVKIESNNNCIHQYCESVRLYTVEEIKNILHLKGFQRIDLYGGVLNEDFSEDSSRLLIIARKPK